MAAFARKNYKKYIRNNI